MSGNGWFRFPRWVRRRITNDKARGLYELLADLVNNTTRTWRGTQSYLAHVMNASIRTIQRWLSHLREVGVIRTHQWIDGRGYHSTNVYYLPLDESDISCPPLGGGPVTKTRITSKTLSSSLRSDEREQAKRGSAQEAVVKVAVDQLSLFEGTEDEQRFDSRNVEGDTNNGKIAKKGAERRCGTPAGRVRAYWLAGRKEQPKAGVVIGVTKAIRTCLDSGRSESEVRGALDALMIAGLDAYPSQLLTRFGLHIRPKRPKKRDYEKDPLWKRQPKSSTMTSQRKIDTTPAPFRPVSPTPATDATSAPPSQPWSMPATLNIGTGKRYCGVETTYDAGTVHTVEHRPDGVTPGEVLRKLFGRL